MPTKSLESFIQLVHEIVKDSQKLITKLQNNEIIQIHTKEYIFQTIQLDILREILELFDEIETQKNKIIIKSKRMSRADFKKKCSVMLNVINQIMFYDIRIIKNIIDSSNRLTWKEHQNSHDQNIVDIQENIWNDYIQCFAPDETAIPHLQRLYNLTQKYQKRNIPELCFEISDYKYHPAMLHIFNINAIIRLSHDRNSQETFYAANPVHIPKARLFFEALQRYIHSLNDLDKIRETSVIYKQIDELNKHKSWTSKIIDNVHDKHVKTIKACQHNTIKLITKNVQDNISLVNINNQSVKETYSICQKEGRKELNLIRQTIRSFYEILNQDVMIRPETSKSTIERILEQVVSIRTIQDCYLKPGNIALMDRFFLR